MFKNTKILKYNPKTTSIIISVPFQVTTVTTVSILPSICSGVNSSWKGNKINNFVQNVDTKEWFKMANNIVNCMLWATVKITLKKNWSQIHKAWLFGLDGSSTPTLNEPKYRVNGKWRSIGGEGHENVIVLHKPFRLSEKLQRSNLKLY